jgi:Cu(I)/Ag(I) efflux system membrane protein CusA/SilA
VARAGGKLPAGYSVSWSGQFEFLERAAAKTQAGGAVHAAHHLRAAVPDLPHFGEALLLMATLPFALVGGIWLLWTLGHNLSVAGAWASSRWPAWRPSSA